MNRPGTLYYFTNAYPFGMGESWKKNELEVFSKYFQKIHVVPLSYDGNQNPKQLPANASTIKPVLESSTNLFALIWAMLFSKIGIEALREFFREKVFLSVSKAKAFFDTVILISRLYNHPIFSALRSRGAQPNTTLYFFWGTGLAHALIFLNRNNFRKVVVRFHGIDLYEERHAGGYIPFRKSQMKQIHLAAPISESGKNYLLSRFKRNDFECDVYRLGCVSAGRAIPSQDGILRIVSCSSIIALKRLDLLAKALALVNFRVHWLHIGDGPLRAEVQALTEKLPPDVSTTFVGRIDPDQLLEYYSGKPMDVFINVSELEGVPVSIMEAFSAGIPVIASNVGGTPEIVNDSVGILLPSDLIPSRLAEEIRRFNAMDSKAKADLRERCYQQYMLNCNAHVWADRMVNKLI